MDNKFARLNPGFSRRDCLRLTSAAMAGASMSGWFPMLAADAASSPARRRSCILLWMSGGPSQTDTFDPKPGHPNGGPIKPIDTSVPGVQISEHLPQLAKWMNDCAVIRSMSTTEGDHGRAAYLMRTGYAQQAPVQYPPLGSLVSNELAHEDFELPNYISIAPFAFFSPAAYTPGFLGPRHAAMVVGNVRFGVPQQEDGAYGTSLKVDNLAAPEGVNSMQADARLALLSGLEDDFRAERPGLPTASHKSAYDSAVRMMRSEAVKAFDLDDEPAAIRDRYGKNQFGQGCLLARRLVERGVPFVEVSLNGLPGQQFLGWDTHQDNFPTVKGLCGILDPAWSTLMDDLKSRGLLETTTIIWMGEFGRSPNIVNGGRDHFPAAWSTVLAGGGIKGGQVIGKTSADGMKVDDRPISHADLMATIVRALGLDPKKQNISNIGRPIRLADPKGKPIEELIA